MPFPYETFQDWKRISQKRKDDFAIRSSNPSSSTNNDAHEEEDTTTMDTSSSLWKLIHLPLLAHPNPNHVVVITMDDDDDNSDYEKNEKNHFNNGTTSTTNVYMRHVWQHRSVVTDLTIVKLIITHSDHDHRSSRIQHQLKQQEQDEIRIRYITIFNWNDLVSMGLWNNHNNHNGPDDSNSSAQRNHHNHTTWNDKNNNKNEDGLSPVNLVLLDQGATGHFLDTATTTDDHLRRQILRVFQSKPNEEEEEDEKDDDDDDDMEDSREPNADTKQPPQNHLTVITEFPGPADHGLSAHRRFQLANLLDRDDDDDVDDDEDWDMMTDYTILVRPRKSHGRPLLNTYVVLWEDSVSQAYWQYNEAEWNRHLHARFAATAMSLDAEEDWIDSTLHLPTEYPSRHSEIVFCQGPLAKETGVDCDIGGGTGIPPDQTNIPTRLLQIQPSSQGDYAGRGLFTTVDIPPHSMVGGEQPMIYLDWPSTELLRSFWRHHETNDIYDDELVDILYSYFDGYGFVRVAKVRRDFVCEFHSSIRLQPYCLLFSCGSYPTGQAVLCGGLNEGDVCQSWL